MQLFCDCPSNGRLNAGVGDFYLGMQLIFRLCLPNWLIEMQQMACDVDNQQITISVG